MSKEKVLGLDLGTNSIGWALLETDNGKPKGLIDLGVRIFNRAVEDKTPTPKNQKRRQKRLARRILQRRTRRKQRMLRYLIKLKLLPQELNGHLQPEIILNKLGNPYHLRKRALDEQVSRHELGRIFLHLVQRRGFLSNKKTLLGDMADDPDVIEVLNEFESQEDKSTERAKEETAFKKDISELKKAINKAKCRTLGEYLSSFNPENSNAPKVPQRNRNRGGGHLRTDRQMYREELEAIWEKQSEFYPELTENIKDQIEEIIFFQRPLKLRADRLGKCSLEPQRKRANLSRLEVQRFRYLQSINNLKLSYENNKSTKLNEDQRNDLKILFESEKSVGIAKLRKTLGLKKDIEFNFEKGTQFHGNVTAWEIRKVLSDWDNWDEDKQIQLVEDLLTINKKSVLKKRLLTYWKFDTKIAVDLCFLEFNRQHSNLSLKAINKLLPYLEKGQLYSEARESAGYGYESNEIDSVERLGAPPTIPNPIVSRALSEVRRLANAIIAEYGKPEIIRIEMARDLEMNTKRYKAFIAQQKRNTKANEDATEAYAEIAQSNPHLALSQYPGHADKLRYRLWRDQDKRCAYSNKVINAAALFSAEIEIDHILPYSQSLDDSYMNKVVCFAEENRRKGQKTPIDAFGGQEEKWQQILGALKNYPKALYGKSLRFKMTAAEVQKRDFLSSQLNDSRYISKATKDYLVQLGSDITTSKGHTTSWLRHQWELNTLYSAADEKDRSDHRHHAIDAAVIACVDRGFYQVLVNTAKDLERRNSTLKMRDLVTDPPWITLRDDLKEKLEELTISHAPQKRLSGQLHEETGVGFKEDIGTIYRTNLDPSITSAQLNKIIDPDVKNIVFRHLEKYGNDPKKAFSDDNTVYHKDGKTPIKRVRIIQAKTTLKKLELDKAGIKDKSGKVFKWHAYGNIHHVEILINNKTGKYESYFVTMMEAHARCKGINQEKKSIIQTQHGPDIKFIMALHINDTVSVEINKKTALYRVQKLDRPNRISLRLNTAATLDDKNELIKKSIHTLMTDFKMKKHELNILGKNMNDIGN